MTTNNNHNNDTPPRIAVIGGGVAGMAAAWHLAINTDCRVQLYEARDTLGGHAWTVQVPTDDGAIPVDIGFMVFNHDNYPNLCQWFRSLGVQEEDSDMSLSVSLDQGLEWSSDGLSGLLARRSNALRPSFYRFLADMMRFHKEAPEILQLDPADPRRHVTTGQYLREHGYSAAFATYYLLPMMAALWSASLSDVLQFPAAQLVGFLSNHQMLQLFDRPSWKTVQGRSQTYTQAVASLLGDAVVKTNTQIRSVVGRQNNHGKPSSYELKRADGASLGTFDQVVFACQPGQALEMLQRGGDNNGSRFPESSPQLASLLSQIQYADNVIYVHSDPQLMPTSQQAWASWNCLGRSDLLQEAMGGTAKSKQSQGAMEGADSGFGSKKAAATENGPEGGSSSNDRMKAVYVTYWLNRLQNLETDRNIFVSLNPHERPDPSLTHHCLNMAHPQFQPATLQARDKLNSDYQGTDGLWFCGAWQGYGFHEDGCRSGFEVATQLSGVPLPWCADDTTDDEPKKKQQQLILPPPDLSSRNQPSFLQRLHQRLFYDLPVAVCKRFIFHFLRQAVQHGQLQLRLTDGSVKVFGDGTPCGCGDSSSVVLRVFDDWFFVKTALEYDLGLARSYMAGYFVAEPLLDKKAYHPVMVPADAREEVTTVLGDPVGLTRLFLLLIGNRDGGRYVPRKAGQGHWYSNALTNASGLLLAKVGSLFNYIRYKLTMDNSEYGGSLKNIHAHYDISNDLFTTFLDKETLMYSSAIYDAIASPTFGNGLVFRGTLEEAQWRKLDTLLRRAQIRPGQTLLDIGFGWGGLSIHAAKQYGCHVTGITLSVEQKALAEQRVKEAGVEHMITFEVADYRSFARRKANQGKFDRVVSCEMIEAVGHEYLSDFFWAVEQVLAADGILVMEAITTPEQRYETYRRSTDFINTIIFPGSCCPSLHALIDAAYKGSCLTLEHIDNIGLHYAQTLAEWRRRFNANEAFVRELGFDDVFLRAWNYYLTYCEAGFFSQTENCLILVFARQGCRSLAPLCETRSVTQALPLTNKEISDWLG